MELYILDDSGKPVKRDEKILSNESEQRISFSLSGFESGKYEGFVALTGADAFSEDDCRWFSFERTEAKNVLLVTSSENQKAQFLTAALSPKSLRTDGKNRYNCNAVSQSDFESESFGLDKMSKYKLTFLLNPAPMSADAWKKLESWTEQGGGLCIVLGDNASDVSAFNSPESQTVLAGKVQIQARAGDGVFVLPRSYVHPILVPFEKVANSVPWTQNAVFRYWQMSDFPSDVNVVLRYSDLRPFILERPVGAGRALTITTPIDSASSWNALASAQNWVFFVLINQTADYLSSSGVNRLNYRAGETAEIKQSEESDEWKITMYSKPSGTLTSEKAPETQLVRAQKDAVRIPGLMTAGYIAAESESESGSSEKFFLSYNYSEKDTDLTRLDSDQLKDFFGSCPWSQSRDRKQIEQRVSTGRAGWELFPILAILFCLLLAAETWLSQRFYR